MVLVRRHGGGRGNGGDSRCGCAAVASSCGRNTASQPQFGGYTSLGDIIGDDTGGCTKRCCVQDRRTTGYGIGVVRSGAGARKSRVGAAKPGWLDDGPHVGWHRSSAYPRLGRDAPFLLQTPPCELPPPSDSRFSIITGVSTGSDGSSDSHAPKGSTPSPPQCRKYSSPAKRPRRALPPTSRQRARGKASATAPTLAGAQTPPSPLVSPSAATLAGAQNVLPPMVSPLAAAAAGVFPATPRLAPVTVTDARPSGGLRRATVGSFGPPIPQPPGVVAPITDGGVASALREGAPPPLRTLSTPTTAGTAALSSVFSVWFSRSRAALRAATDGTASAATAAAAAATAAAGSTPPPAPCAQVSLALLATELTLYSNALSTLLPALVPWLPHPAVIEAYQMDATAHAASALGLVHLATVDAAGAFLAAHQLAVVVEAHAEKMSVHLLPLAGQAVGGDALMSLIAAVAPPPSVAPLPIASPTEMGGVYPGVGRMGALGAPGSGIMRAG